MDRNGYNPSIMQRDTSRCYLCGRCDQKLDRHEPFGGALRQKSKAWGLWVVLCHERCHEYGRYAAHRCKDTALLLKKEAQQRAQDYYNITTDGFIEAFGKNYLE